MLTLLCLRDPSPCEASSSACHKLTCSCFLSLAVSRLSCRCTLASSSAKARAKSTKNRHRKSPRFSVANVPVASLTAMGHFFPVKNCNRIASGRDFPSQGKSQGCLRWKHSFGVRKIAAVFDLHWIVAIAIAIAILEKSRQVHSEAGSRERHLSWDHLCFCVQCKI